MPDVLPILFLILQIIWWPINQILTLLIIIVSPFWNLAVFLALPFIHLGATILGVITAPFKLQWLERFETLYVFLGTAGLIGCLTGTVVFIFFKFLSSTLNIDGSVESKPRKSRRTVKQFREDRQLARESEDHSPVSTPVVMKKGAGESRRSGLLSQAIFEEEDSDF